MQAACESSLSASARELNDCAELKTWNKFEADMSPRFDLVYNSTVGLETIVLQSALLAKSVKRRR